MAGLICLRLDDRLSAAHWFGRSAADDPEAAYRFGSLLVSEHNDLKGARHWFRRAAERGHQAAQAELRKVLPLTGGCVETEGCLLDPPPPYWTRPAEPEQAARAELAVAAARRRGDAAAEPAALVEILGTWDLVARESLSRGLPDVPAGGMVGGAVGGMVELLARTSGLHLAAIEHLGLVRATLLRPGTAPWPTPAEVEHVLGTARDLRSHFGLR